MAAASRAELSLEDLAKLPTGHGDKLWFDLHWLILELSSSHQLWHNRIVPRKQVQFFLLSVLLAALPLAARAQDKAQLPYSVVSEYLQLFKSLEHLNLIVPSMMISSTNPEVSPEAIELKIHSSGGWLSFSPDENDVIEFPEQPDWAKSNLVSNQPKGTLELLIGFSARPLKSTSLSYQELMALVPQFDEAMTALAGVQGQQPSKVKGLTIQLSEGSTAAVHVLSQKGKQTLKPYSTGVVVIRYNDALWQENPTVEFDELPLGIVPLR